MPKYVQILSSGVVHTIMESTEQFDGPGIVEVQEYDVWYVGSYFDGAGFSRLEIEPDNGGQVALGQVLSVAVKWIDIQGQTVVHNSVVKVTCGGMVEDVTVIDGIGIMTFEAAEVGEYILVADSPEGCRAVGRVAVE